MAFGGSLSTIKKNRRRKENRISRLSPSQMPTEDKSVQGDSWLEKTPA